MATIVDSWGGNGSNAYVSLTAAHSYITNAIYDASAWTDATTSQREAALIEATIDIDRLHWVGSRYYPDQRLEFPRTLASHRVYPYTTVGSPDSVLQSQMKNDVERATCYQALYIARNAGRNEHAERIQQGIRAISENVGPIKEFVSYSGPGGAAVPQILDQRVVDILARWRAQPRLFRA
jgi:hypothetical protein